MSKLLRRLMFRPRAILCCLYYGLLPWRVYESRCHYAPMSYAAHAAMNLRYCLNYLRPRVDFGSRRFEIRVNHL